MITRQKGTFWKYHSSLSNTPSESETSDTKIYPRVLYVPCGAESALDSVAGGMEASGGRVTVAEPIE